MTVCPLRSEPSWRGGWAQAMVGPATPGADGIAAAANLNLNGAYTSLLAVLHQLVNGQSDAPTFHRALPRMMSMKEQAKGMMSSTSSCGQVYIGPSFEHQL